MQTIYLKRSLFTGAVGLLCSASIHASTPLWEFSSPSPLSTIVSPEGTASVQYTVTNKSIKSKNLILKTTLGLSASPCYLAQKGSTCVVTLTVNGSAVLPGGIKNGPFLCEQGNSNQCYQPSEANRLSVTLSQGPALLNASVADLALSVTGLSVPSGSPRIITITNNGGFPATNLTMNYPTWPTGTTVDASSTCVNGGTLVAGGSCTIVIKPGASSTSNCTTGILPTPDVITVSANNSAPISINALVLAYGCQYQGGFLYAVDDTTPSSGSIGGKVATLVNQALVMIWSANNSGSYDNGVSIFGISEISTVSSPDPNGGQEAGQLPCDGNLDGSCDSNNIVTYYSSINLSYYAAGFCKATINTYSDWYLPAICELDSINNSSICPNGTQNMLGGLPFLIGDQGAPTPSTSCSFGSGCLVGIYWSSTQDSSSPQTAAWAESFDNGGSFAAAAGKGDILSVRCSRAVTF